MNTPFSNKFFLLSLLFLLLFSGCIQKNSYSECCNYDIAYDTISQNNPQCALPGGELPKGVSTMDTNSCSLEEMSCNVTLFYTEGGKEEKIIPICPKLEEDKLCVNPNCMTMVCGNFHYEAALPEYAETSAQSGEDINADTVSKEMESSEVVSGLYNGICLFREMNEQLTNAFKDARGTKYVNTFRLGIGRTFKEYEEQKYYFPHSDIYCGYTFVSAVSDDKDQRVVDRYMNYLLPPNEISNHICYGGTFDPITTFGQDLSLDEIAEQLPFQTGAYSGDISSDQVNGKYVTMTEVRGVNAQSMIYDTKVAVGTENFNTIYYVDEIDKEFYADALSIIYYKDINEYGIAPFECQSGKDCLSGNCATDVYSRSVCKFKSQYAMGAVERDCGCHVIKSSDESYVEEVYCDAKKYTNYLTIPLEIAEEKGTSLCDTNLFDYTSLTSISKKSRTLTMSYCVNIVDDENELDSVLDYADGDILSHHEDLSNNEDLIISLIEAEAEKQGDTFNEFKIDGTLLNQPSTYSDRKATIDYIFFRSHVVQEYDENGAVIIASATPHEDITICYSGVPESESPDKEHMHTNIEFKDNFAQTFLDPDEFELSKLKVACELVKGVDYSVHGESSILEGTKSYAKWVPGQEEGEQTSMDGYYHYYYDGIHYNYYARNMIFVTSLGKCENGAETASNSEDLISLYPVTKEYGWCEPCSYLTLASQTIQTTDDLLSDDGDYYIGEYLPRTVTYIHNDEFIEFANAYLNGDNLMGLDNPDTTKVCEYNMIKLDPYTVSQDCIPEETNYGLDYAEFDEDSDLLTEYSIPAIPVAGPPKANIYPELTFMQKKSAQYLKENVLPIWDMSIQSYDSVWEPVETAYANGDAPPDLFDFLLDNNRGPAIVVVGTISNEPESMPVELIPYRIQAVKHYCYNCLTAVHVSADLGKQVGFISAETRRAKDMEVISDLRAVDPQTFDYNLDLILFDFYPHEVTKSLSECPEGKELNEGIIANISEYGFELLINFKKSSLIYTYYVNTNAKCWSVDTFYSNFVYLMTHQDRFTEAGITGLIYPYINPTVPQLGYTSEFEEAFKKASRFIIGEKPIMVLSRVDAKQELTAINCSNEQIQVGLCSGLKPLNEDSGKECTVPAGEDKSTYQCPPDTVLEPCQKCSEFNDMLQCSKTYSNGTIDKFQIKISELSASTADVLASIVSIDSDGSSKPFICCLNDTKQLNYTFVKNQYIGRQNSPIIYSTTGDPEYSCAQGVDLGMLDGFCGTDIQLPVKDYKLECTKN